MMRNHRHIQKARSSETAKNKHLLIIAYIFCLVLAAVKRSGLFFYRHDMPFSLRVCERVKHNTAQQSTNIRKCL